MKWLGRSYKRLKVSLETMYLSISYLIKYVEMNTKLESESESEYVFAVLLLLAAKMNEIYYPSINSLIRVCS